MARVLVTGGRRGIGLATALELARRGHQVLGDVRRAEQLDELRARASDAAVALEPVVLDVTDPDSIATAVGSITGSGPLDVVVNNAAILPVGPVELMDVDVIRETFEANVVGPMVLSGAVLPAMRAQGGGRIVTIASGSRHPRLNPPVFGSAYAASKAAADCWAEAFNKETIGFDVRSVIVELGGFEDAARCIADVVEHPAPPLRTVYPPELEALIARSQLISDDDYLDHCRATSGRDWSRAIRQALTS